jgi:hypothetical protein
MSCVRTYCARVYRRFETRDVKRSCDLGLTYTKEHGARPGCVYLPHGKLVKGRSARRGAVCARPGAAANARGACGGHLQIKRVTHRHRGEESALPLSETRESAAGERRETEPRMSQWNTITHSMGPAAYLRELLR